MYHPVLHVNTGSTDPDYHHVKVEGTSEPLTFYGLHNQHINPPYGSRILFDGASNISVYGLKHEDKLGDDLPAADWPVSVLVTNCRNVQIVGMSGLAETADGRGLVEFVGSDDVLLANGVRWHNSATGEVLSAHYYVKEFYNAETNTVLAANTTVLNLFRRGEPSGTGELYDEAEQVGYETWVFGRGLSDDSRGADPDGDGIPNELEYALGSNPSITDAHEYAEVGVTNIGEADLFMANYTFNSQALRIPRAVFTDDLVHGKWVPGTVYETAGMVISEFATNTFDTGFGRFVVAEP